MFASSERTPTLAALQGFLSTSTLGSMREQKRTFKLPLSCRTPAAIVQLNKIVSAV
jgi:hypothetical protein